MSRSQYGPRGEYTMPESENEPAAIGEDHGGDSATTTSSFSLESPEQSSTAYFDRLALVSAIHLALRDSVDEEIVSDNHLIGLRVHWRGRVYQVVPEESR
jgi:hypothetical protein